MAGPMFTVTYVTANSFTAGHGTLPSFSVTIGPGINGIISPVAVVGSAIVGISTVGP